MAYKNKKDQREYAKKHYLKNKEEYKNRAKNNTEKYRKRNRIFINEYKLKCGCSVCGYNKSSVALDFHHNGDEKDKNVAILSNRASSINRILNEIEKCIVICANCHRELHNEE